MNVVHFRISQISIPFVESQNEYVSYFLSVHIGPTFIEFPLELVDKKFLKSQTVISFNYDLAADYKFYLELYGKKPHSDEIEIASLEIPLRICKRNRRSNGSLEMEIKNKDFLDSLSTKNDNDDDDEEYEPEEDEYDSEDDDKGIKIFFEIHRSEDKKKRFEAPLEELRDYQSSLLTVSRQSFESSCSFIEPVKKKKRNSSKLTVSHQEETEIETEQKQENEQLEEENQQTTSEKDQKEEEENDEIQPQKEEENDEIQPQKEEGPQIIEEEEEESDEKNSNESEKNDDDDEKIESNDNDKSKSKNNNEELIENDENDRPSRKHFLNQSDSQSFDEDDVGEGNENKIEQFNILDDDDDNSIPPIEPKEQNSEEKQISIPLNLSSDSAQFAVYPPRKKSSDLLMNGELEQSDSEINEQPEQENQEKTSDIQENPESNEQQQQQEIESNEQQQQELESNEQQQELESNEQQQQEIESNEQQQQQELESNEQEKENENDLDSNDQQKELESNEQHEKVDIQMNEKQNAQNENIFPPLSVENHHQQVFYPNLADFQDDAEPPVQQQPPILKFSSLNMNDFECLDNFSFYPSPEQIGTYYIPPSLLSISIHPPSYD